MKKYNLKEVKKIAHPIDSFWTVKFMNPLANRITLLFANHTKITPNTVTLFSSLLVLSSIYFFLNPNTLNFLIGGILFQAGFLFDCIDGKLARLTKRTSKQGAFLDTFFDSVLFVMAFISFSYGLSLFFEDYIFLLISTIYISNFWIESVTPKPLKKIKGFKDETDLKNRFIKEYENKKNKKIVLGLKYFFWKRGIRMRFDRFTSEGLLFLIAPILGYIFTNSRNLKSIFLFLYIFTTSLLILFNFIEGVMSFILIRGNKK